MEPGGYYSAQSHAAHQPGDRTARYGHAFACQLPPHLVGAPDLQVDLVVKKLCRNHGFSEPRYTLGIPVHLFTNVRNTQ
jgi:hypothetical protein